MDRATETLKALTQCHEHVMHRVRMPENYPSFTPEEYDPERDLCMRCGKQWIEIYPSEPYSVCEDHIDCEFNQEEDGFCIDIIYWWEEDDG